MAIGPIRRNWIHHETTVSLARGKLGLFEEGLNVDEELAHGGDDGAFVGFAAIAKAFDVGGEISVQDYGRL